jgi:hypothetical protein
MTHSGGTHGPRQDDALKKEVRGEVQANRATRTEEWREPEPPGEDQPDATWDLSDGAGTRREAIQLRSDIARHLDHKAFPADRDGLLADMSDHHAPQPLLDLVATLPADVTFRGLPDVTEALGLPVDEEHAG